MRKKRRWSILFLLAFLCGCASSREEREFEQWRAGLVAAEEIRFDAELTARWEDAVDSFTVRVVCADGETAATITAPETIAGITFRRGAADTLTFDGLILDMDAGHTNAVAPCEGPALLLAAIRDGWPLSFSRAGEGDAVELEAPGGEVVTLFRAPDGTPLSAAIARDGVTELTLRIEHWQTKE